MSSTPFHPGNIEAIEYDKQNGLVTVQFKNGASYKYPVSNQLYSKMLIDMKSKSAELTNGGTKD